MGLVRSLASSSVCVLILLAGCLSPGGTTGGTSGDPPPTASLDLDLHEQVLSIAMPEGQPTALVALAVTKDMWVRPNLGLHEVPTRSTDYWALCPWVKSVGLPETVRYKPFSFWLQDGTLVPARDAPLGSALSESMGGGCAAFTYTQHARGNIRADEPFDGTLVVLLAAQPARPGADEPPTPAFRYVVGIAREPCPGDEARLCPPETEVPAEPVTRAAIAVVGSYNTNDDVGPCGACGLDLDDRTTRTPPLPDLPAVSTGEASARTLPAFDAGFAMLVAGYNGGGRVESTLTVDGDVLADACDDTYYGAIAIMAAHQTRVEGTSSIALSAGPYWGFRFTDTPIDFSALGWKVEPQVSTMNIEQNVCT